MHCVSLTICLSVSLSLCVSLGCAAEHAPQLGPGFWIRFTVHYNLCMGTVLGLGSEEQVRELDVLQERGEERRKGVVLRCTTPTPCPYPPLPYSSLLFSALLSLVCCAVL